MFNFSNLRAVTKKMKNDGKKYAKNFWQAIFNGLPLIASNPIQATLSWKRDSSYPAKADPLHLVKEFEFDIIYTATGNITIICKKYDSNDDIHTMLLQVLCDNGFKKEENVYTRNIK